jgi:hypothetical protein
MTSAEPNKIAREQASSERQRFDISLHIPSRTAVKVGLSLVAGWAALRLWPEFLLLLFAVILAIALHPMVTWLERKGVGRGAAIVAIAIALMGVIVGFLALVTTSLAEQISHLVLAPEQILGGTVDGRVDLFALGVVMYEMLHLEPLFYGEGGDLATVHRTLEKQIDPPSSFRFDVSPAFDRTVMRALSREPALRYQTAVEMERDLDAAFDSSGLVMEDIAQILADIRNLPVR